MACDQRQIPDKSPAAFSNQIATSLILFYLEILEPSLSEYKLCACPEPSPAPDVLGQFIDYMSKTAP